MFYVFNDSTSDNCFIYYCYSRRDGCLWAIQELLFPILYSLNLENFRFIVSLTILLAICSVLGRAQIISIIQNGVSSLAILLINFVIIILPKEQSFLKGREPLWS